MYKDCVLKDIPWIKTNQGLKTVEYVLKNMKNIQLDIDVPGYEYSSQFRFIMTIFATLINRLKGDYSSINDESIDKVLEELSSASHLLDENDPFLQLPLSLAKEKDKLVEGQAQVSKHPNKLLPAEPSEKQIGFWGFEKYLDQEIPVEEAVPLLVSSYYYRSGGNGELDKRKPLNGASALRYAPIGTVAPATEIIPIGESLFITLLLSTPLEFCQGENIFPHWADRNGVKSKGTISPLWLSSWTTNTVFVFWETNKDTGEIKLKSVGIGGAPEEWWPKPLFLYGVKDQWKEATAIRDYKDPLYFYMQDKKTGEWKMRYLGLGSEPHYFIARWNAERCFETLKTKWSQNISFSEDKVENIIFVEHATSATAMAFVIRHSKVIEGYKDEMLPTGDPDRISEIYESILRIRGKLTGFFTDNGGLNFIKTRKEVAESYFWDEISQIIEPIAKGEIKKGEVNTYAVKAAIKALNYVAPLNNTVQIESRLKAEDALRGMAK